MQVAILTCRYIHHPTVLYNHSGLQPHSFILKIFFTSSSDDLKVIVSCSMGTQVLYSSTLLVEQSVIFPLYEDKLFKLSFNNDTYKIG